MQVVGISLTWFFAVSNLSKHHGQFTWKQKISHFKFSNNKINCPKDSNKQSVITCIAENTLHLLGKQMGFALCLEGHQPWALPDQQRKRLLLKIPSCLSPRQTWQKWLLNPGTSFPLVLAITARLIRSKALVQVLTYSARCLNVSAEAQAEEKDSPSGPNLDVNDGDVSWR